MFHVSIMFSVLRLGPTKILSELAIHRPTLGQILGFPVLVFPVSPAPAHYQIV
jgi:hypothetical protein